MPDEASGQGTSTEHTYAYGGAVYQDGGNLGVTNSLFALNASDALGSRETEYGSAIYLNSGVGNVVNCTIVEGNGVVAGKGGATAIYRAGGTLSVMNSILYDNNPSGSTNGPQFGGSMYLAYNDIQNGPQTNGNIDVSPGFIPGRCRDYVLDPKTPSPCIDAGNPDSAYNDSAFCGDFSLGRERNDMGAYGGPGAAAWCCACIAFLSQPRSLVKCVGQDAEFSVVVDSSGPETYQWYFNTNTPIPGATSPTLHLTSVQTNNVGMYHVVVANQFCTSNSFFASLLVTRISSVVDLYPGIWFTNLTSNGTYEVQYAYDATQTNGWTPLATFTATNSTQFWYDPEPARNPTRFYKVIMP